MYKTYKINGLDFDIRIPESERKFIQNSIMILSAAIVIAAIIKSKK